MDVVFILFPGRVGDIDTVITDPLQISDGVQDLTDHQLIIRHQSALIDPHDIGGKHCLTLVQKLFIFLQLRELGCVILVDHIRGDLIVRPDRLRHFTDQLLALLESDGRGIEKHIVQLRKLHRLLALLFHSAQAVADLRHTIGTQKQDNAGEQVEEQMHGCDAASVYGIRHPGESEDAMETVDQRHEEYRSEDVEQEVTPGHLLCLLIRTHQADDDGHTFSEIDTDDHGDRHGIGNRTRCGKGLQDTD